MLLAWKERKLWIEVKDIPWLTEALQNELTNCGDTSPEGQASAVAEPAEDGEENGNIAWHFRDEAYVCKLKIPGGGVLTCRKFLKRRTRRTGDLHGLERDEACKRLYEECAEWRRQMQEEHGLCPMDDAAEESQSHEM